MIGYILAAGAEQNNIDKTLDLTRNLANLAVDKVADGFRYIGVSIGAIMLLIVIVYYLASILDGGKFQLKMLIPFFIFLLVCNFSWVAKPVVAFSTTITEKLIKACDNKSKEILAEEVGAEDTENYFALAQNRYYNKLDESPFLKKNPDGTFSSPETVGPGVGVGVIAPNEDEVEAEALSGKSNGSGNGNGGVGGTPPTGSSKSLTKKEASDATRDGVSNSLTEKGESYQTEFTNSVKLIQNQQAKGIPFWAKGILGLITSFICWLMGMLKYVVMCLGGVMTAIVVTFGPITFAFAILPGQASTIKSWFIRIVQFSLYGPIVSVITLFTDKCFALMINATDAASCFISLAMALCAIVGITSVPTIASMIVEGAQGAVSLSSGLQTLAHGLSTSDAIMKKGGNAIIKTAGDLGGDKLRNAVGDMKSGINSRGGIQMAKDMMNFGPKATFKHASKVGGRIRKSGRK